MAETKRATFGSKLGIILASVGSAVGLGNIWRFPYEAGSGGGGAFLIVYLLCVLGLGLPLMMTEFMIGRRSGSNAVQAFEKLSGKKAWDIIGAMGVVTSMIIIGFYSVVAGWTLEYIYQAVSGSLANKSTEMFTAEFAQFISDPVRPIMWTVLFMVITHIIIVSGIKKGIERSSKILMPALFLILLALCIRSLLLPGAEEGLRFLLWPDFSKINSSVILSAMGQAFFSLSLGCACMITYASYFSGKDNLRTSALSVTMLDTLVAILSGVMIFPAVFSFGIEPTLGPTLVFVTLPNIFAQLPLGGLWAFVFFVLLALAALTSIISLHEVITAFVCEKFKTSRRIGALAVTATGCLFAAVCSLSLGRWSGYTVCGMNIFDASDFLTAKILMPLGAFMVCIFAGWVMGHKAVEDELGNHGSLRFKAIGLYMFFLKFIAPIAIVLIFLNELGLFQS